MVTGRRLENDIPTTNAGEKGEIQAQGKCAVCSKMSRGAPIGRGKWEKNSTTGSGQNSLMEGRRKKRMMATPSGGGEARKKKKQVKRCLDKKHERTKKGEIEQHEGR